LHNSYRFAGGGITVKEIKLTQGKTALVDDEDFKELNKFRWHADKKGNTFYSIRNPSGVNGKSRTVYMHAVIVGTPTGMETDHINGDGLDNRRENLRVVSRRMNAQNRHIPKSSKYPGVSWHKKSGEWQARIRIRGKTRHLGVFNDEEVAGIIYAMACNVLKMGNEGCRPEPLSA